MCDCANCGSSNTPSDMWPSDAGLICQECWEFQCDQAWWETVYPALQSPRRVPLPTEPYAPRPLWTAALYRYRAGILDGTRRYQCLGSLAWYRQHRPRQRPLFFGASDCHGTLVASGVRPLAGLPEPPDCAWCGGPAERAIPGACTALCPQCLDYWLHGAADLRKGMYRKPNYGRRGRYTRPYYRFSSPSDPRIVRAQRISHRTHLWKRRTRFLLRAGTLHYLATRRYAAQQCRKLGFRRIKPGVWYDASADRVYLQADSIEPCEHIQLGAA